MEPCCVNVLPPSDPLTPSDRLVFSGCGEIPGSVEA